MLTDEEWANRRALLAAGDFDPSTFRDAGGPIRGISHLLALALAAMDLDVLRRSTIRSLLPRYAAPKFNGTNHVRRPAGVISRSINTAYRMFEEQGWIERITDGELLLVRVLDRESLFGWVVHAVDLTTERAAHLLDVAHTVQQLQRERVPVDVHGTIAEFRRQELLALKRLMEAAPGSLTRERGRVVLVPKGRPL